MSCCGRSTAGGTIVIRQKDIDEGLRFEVEYWGGSVIEILGAGTGQRYIFSATERNGFIEPTDIAGVLRNPAFRLKGTQKAGSI
jgi:hypothetical protein